MKKSFKKLLSFVLIISLMTFAVVGEVKGDYEPPVINIDDSGCFLSIEEYNSMSHDDIVQHLEVCTLN